MKQTIRSVVLRTPGLRYASRLAVHLFRLPYRNDAIREQLNSHEAHLNQIVEEQSNLRREITEARQNLEIKKDQFDNYERRLRLMDGKVADISHSFSRLKLPAASQSQAAAPPQSQQGSGLFADDHSLDQFYIEFENKFRGPEEVVKKRLEVYLPYLKPLKKQTADKPLLDIGCGRGEFLQLLKDNAINAKGLDLNESMVRRATEQGLDVVQADAMQYLHDLPTASVSGVSGFHLVEHIPFAALLKLMDECYRVIAPGGYAIFETPNPENIIVGSLNFYHDPSHLNPIPPALLAFVMETRGFSKVEIKRLHPMEKDITSDDELVKRMAERLYGPSDYAVVAQK